MYDYYCKNCNNIIGEWNNEHKHYHVLYYCNFINSKNIPIKFLDCKNCNKFVGIACFRVCKNCFGKDVIIKEENLFNWFLKYKKIINFNYLCKNCDNKKFRSQYWFFEELTFYKQ